MCASCVDDDKVSGGNFLVQDDEQRENWLSTREVERGRGLNNGISGVCRKVKKKKINK